MHSKKPQFWGILGLPPYYDCMSKYRRSSALCYSWLRESYRKEVFFVRKRAVHICLQKSRFRAHFVFMLKIVFCRIFYLNSSPVAEEGWSMIVKNNVLRLCGPRVVPLRGVNDPLRPRVASESPNNEAKRARNVLESVILGQRDLASHQNHPTMRQSELATR